MGMEKQMTKSMESEMRTERIHLLNTFCLSASCSQNMEEWKKEWEFNLFGVIQGLLYGSIPSCQ